MRISYCFILLLVMLQGPAQAAATATAPVWTHTAVGPDWSAPAHIRDGLEVSAASARVLVSDVGHLWRISVDASSGELSREFSTTGGTPDDGLQLLGGTAAPLFAQLLTGAEFQSFCTLQRNNADLSMRWRRAMDDASFCSNTIQLRSGNIASAGRSMLLSLGDGGQVRWQRSLAEVGDGHGASVLQLLETVMGRLLVVGTSSFGGRPRHFVWVLDSDSGSVLALHLYAAGLPVGGRVLATRSRADGVVEVLSILTTAGLQRPLVARWTATGEPLSESLLEAFPTDYDVLGAAHANGFALSGRIGANQTEVRQYDGTNLRWRSSYVEDSQPYRLQVSTLEEVVCASFNAVRRFTAGGTPLPLIEQSYGNVQYAPDGALWLQESAVLSAQIPDISVAKYLPGAATAQFEVPIRIPARVMNVAHFSVNAQSQTEYLGSLNSADATSVPPDRRLISTRLDAQGQALTLFNLSWPEVVRTAQRLDTSWLVLSFDDAFIPNRSTLTSLDLAGVTRWQRALPVSSSLRCDRQNLCALSIFDPDEGSRVERLGPDGQVIDVQAAALTLRTTADGRGLRALDPYSVPDQTSLLRLDAGPLQLLARAPFYEPKSTWTLADRLLRQEPTGLKLYGLDQLLWTRPLTGEVQTISTRNDRLDVVRRPAAGQALQLLSLDPPSGVVRQTTDLPVDVTAVRAGVDEDWPFPQQALIETTSDDLTWVAVDRPVAGSVLALRPGRAIREFGFSSYPQDLRASPGDAVIVMAYDARQNLPKLQFSRFEVELFRDGLED